MTTPTKTLRCTLAMLMALWTPLWCCCVTSSVCRADSGIGIDAGTAHKASGCHEATANGSHKPDSGKSTCGMPTDRSGDDSNHNCDCPSYQTHFQSGSFDLVAVSAGTIDHLSFPPVLVASFLWDVAPQAFAHHQAQANPRDNGGDTLRALHCLLLI